MGASLDLMRGLMVTSVCVGHMGPWVWAVESLLGDPVAFFTGLPGRHVSNPW